VGTVYLGWKARGILRTVDSRLDPALVASVVRMGGPIGMRYFLEMGSYLVFTAIITRVGPIELAAHVVVVRICMVSFLPGHAVGDACGVLVGQFVGAAQTDRAQMVVRSGIKLGICIMLGWGMVFCTVPDLLVAPFQVEASAVNVAIQLLYIAALFQVFDAVVMVLQGSMSGAGDTRFVMVSTLITSWLIKVPLGAYLALGVGMGAVGSWLGFMAELIILSLICALRMRSDAWLSHRALEEVSR
jgi:MATE family multidrug resistance protein